MVRGWSETSIRTRVAIGLTVVGFGAKAAAMIPFIMFGLIAKWK